MPARKNVRSAADAAGARRILDRTVYDTCTMRAMHEGKIFKRGKRRKRQRTGKEHLEIRHLSLLCRWHIIFHRFFPRTESPTGIIYLGNSLKMNFSDENSRKKTGPGVHNYCIKLIRWRESSASEVFPFSRCLWSHFFLRTFFNVSFYFRTAQQPRGKVCDSEVRTWTNDFSISDRRRYETRTLLRISVWKKRPIANLPPIYPPQEAQTRRDIRSDLTFETLSPPDNHRRAFICQ